MWGKRYDGRRVKKLDPLALLMPYVMTTRTDSQNQFSEDFFSEPLDEYIKAKSADGINLTYMSILIACIMRVIAERPALNRFIMNKKIYTRNKIWISFVVQRSLRDDSAETTIKLAFDGTESILDVNKAVVDAVEKTTKKETSNDTDKLAKIISLVPGPLMTFVFWMFKALDKLELLPKSIVEASPFHTTLFITNLKSLGINYIFHHVYEFGTTGLFIALGKERLKVVPGKDGVPESKKVVTLGVVTDERFCDGLYFARSIKLLKRYMANPALLETPLAKKVEDVE